MFPPQSGVNINLEALSGICGSISIACWVVVFSPQIIENFRRSSAEGLSITFIVVWLAGDIFNILGAILQGVLPTMIILAVYYTLADIVLLLQVFYYRGFTLKDTPKPDPDTVQADSRGPDATTPLLSRPSPDIDASRRTSYLPDHLTRHAEHFSPATPIHPHPANQDPPAIANTRPTSTIQTILFNVCAIVIVCLAGALGWWLSQAGAQHRHSHHRKHKHYSKTHDHETEPLEFDILGQVFGYLCAVLYLASRIPQILLNYRRKSTEGVSLLFFLFACIGNLTYDMSIFAYNPESACRYGPGNCRDGEARAVYARYILVNLSWIIGSLGTLVLDGGIFVQFFLYRKDGKDTTHVS